MGYEKHCDPAPVCQPWPNIFVECVIVCVDYADFLAWTLPRNRHQFDGIVVVTTPKDRATQKLCEFYHVRCVVSDALHKGGVAFNKAAMINEGLKVLSRRDWVAHMDADILLPPRAKEFISKSQPNPEFIYGIDRVDVVGFESLIDELCEPEHQFVGQAFVQVHRYKPSSRLVVEDGYIPIGFFQLWHPGKSGVDEYSEVHDERNDHSDCTHAKLWPRHKRGLIPEIIAHHLVSDSAAEINWQGRVSAPFRRTK